MTWWWLRPWWWGLAVLLLAVRAYAQPFACTEVVAFSQTGQWHDTAEFQGQIDDARWQLRGRSGGDVNAWAIPSNWNVAVQSRCAAFSTAPDRLILTLTIQRRENNVAVWAREIREMIATARLVHPQVRQIVLQPVVGGPDHRVCGTLQSPVRASYNHPYIDQAIAVVVRDAPDLVAGPSPELQTCGQYADTIGHLTAAGARFVGQQVGAFYAGAPPPPPASTTTTVPTPSTTSTTLGGGGRPLGAPCSIHADCASRRCAFWRAAPICIAP